MKYIDETGCEFENREEKVWIDFFNFCGCRSDTLHKLCFEILQKLHAAATIDGSYYYTYEGVSEEYKDLQELFLHILDSKDLIEHGSAVRGSWLTEKGRALTDFLFDNKDYPK